MPHYEFQTHFSETHISGNARSGGSAVCMDFGFRRSWDPCYRCAGRGWHDSSLLPLSRSGDASRIFQYLDYSVPHFFVRNHMHEPSELSAEDWKLTIGGEVEKPLTLGLAELSKIDAHDVVNTLECAGNGRSLQRPQVPGVQWGKGAVSTARFSGPRLYDVLQRAGVKTTGKHVMFRGLDEVPGKVPPFIRSIPLEKALDPDTLIATHMNGAVLTKHHGFPARALVPGWIGAASCKWLTEIRCSKKNLKATS